MALTDDQKAFFDTFGFLVLRQLLSQSEVARMKRESDEILSEARGGKLYDGTKRQAVQPFFERRQFLLDLIADDRIYRIGESLLGPDFFLISTEGNLHTGDTPWHGGMGQFQILPYIKIGFYLEPLTKETGALRVIPGSHRPEFADRLKAISDRIEDINAKVFGVSQREIPSYAIESMPGDVVVFTEELYHGAFGGHSGRYQHAVIFP